MQSKFTGVKEFLLNQLECPVCTEHMIHPIMLCENGHNICKFCRPKVLHCPICRQQFLNTSNVTLGKLAADVKYPCKYRDYGCSESYGFDLIGQHQAKCQFCPQPCPVNKLNIGYCNWAGISGRMKTHLIEAHRSLCLADGDLNHVSIRVICVTPTTKYGAFILAYDALFYSFSEMKNGIFYSVLKHIGPDAAAAKYRYSLEFVNAEDTEGLKITLLPISLDDNLSEIYNSGNCLKLYPEQFRRFAVEGRDLVFLLEIVTV
jgi:E3 ubiquitin-protein ligase SIAH1